MMDHAYSEQSRFQKYIQGTERKVISKRYRKSSEAFTLLFATTALSACGGGSATEVNNSEGISNDGDTDSSAVIDNSSSTDNENSLENGQTSSSDNIPKTQIDIYADYASTQIMQKSNGLYEITDSAGNTVSANAGDELYFAASGDIVLLPQTGLMQKTAIDISNFDLHGRSWWTPAASGNLGKTKILELHDGQYLVTTLMFDYPQKQAQSTETPISGEVLLIPFDGISFGNLQNITVAGGTPYSFDVDSDGLAEIVMVGGSEDGRLISSFDDVAAKPFILDTETGNITYFGDSAWMHAVGFADLNYDGSADLIVAPIGYDPVSAVYDLATLEEIPIEFQFNGNGEDNIPFGDIDGDGLIEFVETPNIWNAINGKLYLNVYEVGLDGVVTAKQQLEIGSLNEADYTYTEWTSDQPQTVQTGTVFGVDF